jgi:hypothetical protein
MSIVDFIKLKWLELLALFQDDTGKIPEEDKENYTFL